MPLENILFEVTEVEQVVDHDHLRGIFETYRRYGFGTAIDDFGAGYSGLALLADFQPDFIKLDMQLIRGIQRSTPRQVIVRSIVDLASQLDIVVIAEGIEEADELKCLRDLGIGKFQGYFFARPAFEALAPIRFA